MVVESNLHLGKGIVRGNQFPIRRIITRIPAAVTVDEAWLTLKAGLTDADPGLFQKHITTVNVAGTGQIEDNGAVRTNAKVRFDLLAADTTLMVAETQYYFDIKLLFSSGDLLTIERGLTSSEERVTQDS
jgi:hypothetical protein